MTCSIRTSSKLISSTPTPANSSARAPGWSEIITFTDSKRFEPDPCFPGIRALPSFPARRVCSIRTRSLASRAVDNSANSLLTWRSTREISVALPCKMSLHKFGSEPAIRIVSPSPDPEIAKSECAASISCAASALDTNCGTWETSATARSWSAGSMVTRAPPMSVITIAAVIREASLPWVSTQIRS